MRYNGWIVGLIVVLVLLWVVETGTFSVNAQPILVAASSLLTIPLALFAALASTSWGLLLLPVAFLILVYYLRFLDFLLGEPLLIFVIIAAILVVFTNN